MGWKGQLYSILDPGLGAFLYDGVKTDIRIEEVVWGGVAKDGIPDLIDPPVIPASQADYLLPGDRVFGVSINGQHRAYPQDHEPPRDGQRCHCGCALRAGVLNPLQFWNRVFHHDRRRKGAVRHVRVPLPQQ